MDLCQYQEMRGQGYTEKKLQLLSNITGAFRPGVLTALMGISGAGKTTLLDVLAGRKTSGYIEGDIRISGYRKVQETFARVGGESVDHIHGRTNHRAGRKSSRHSDESCEERS